MSSSTMDKHSIFTNCPNRENDKIHTTEIAQQQLREALTPEATRLARENPQAQKGMATYRNIFTSIQSLKPMNFDNANLDELYLLKQVEIREHTNQLETMYSLVRNQILELPTEVRYFLDKLVTESIYLGERIGEFNERIDALQPMRNDKKYTEDRKAGAQKKKAQYQQPTKNLVNDIVTMLEADTQLVFPPKERLANSIISMISPKRKNCLSNSTIQKYIKQSRTIEAQVGQPSKNPTENELKLWLDTHFTHKVEQYFIEK